MDIKEFLQAINIRSASELLARGELLWQASGYAERLRAANVLDEVCQGWGDLPPELQFDLWESAGESNDDRNKITITVLTGNKDQALRVIKIFAGDDYKEGDEESIFLWGDPAFTWGPDAETIPSHFRKVMDAVAVVLGPFNDSRMTIQELRTWVAEVKSVTEGLFNAG